MALGRPATSCNRYCPQIDRLLRGSLEGVQLCRTVLVSTDDKNLSRKTHPAVCGVPTQSF